MSLPFKNNQNILFFGDSITDCGRSVEKPLGLGYVNYFSHMLDVRCPELKLSIDNKGIGGNTAEDLYSRFASDVVIYKPDWLFFLIGINDANQFVTDPKSKVKQSPENYKRYYEQMLEQVKKELPECQLVLMKPFYAVTHTSKDSYQSKVLSALSDYHQVVHNLAEKHSTINIDLQEAFHHQFRFQRPDRYFPREPVHPHEKGHWLIAETIWNKLEK